MREGGYSTPQPRLRSSQSSLHGSTRLCPFRVCKREIPVPSCRSRVCCHHAVFLLLYLVTQYPCLRLNNSLPKEITYVATTIPHINATAAAAASASASYQSIMYPRFVSDTHTHTSSEAPGKQAVCHPQLDTCRYRGKSSQRAIPIHSSSLVVAILKGYCSTR